MWIHAGEPASVVRSHERETFRGREPQRLRLRVFGHRLEQRVLAPTSERMTREVVATARGGSAVHECESAHLTAAMNKRTLTKDLSVGSLLRHARDTEEIVAECASPRGTRREDRPLPDALYDAAAALFEQPPSRGDVDAYVLEVQAQKVLKKMPQSG